MKSNDFPTPKWKRTAKWNVVLEWLDDCYKEFSDGMISMVHDHGTWWLVLPANATLHERLPMNAYAGAGYLYIRYENDWAYRLVGGHNMANTRYCVWTGRGPVTFRQFTLIGLWRKAHE